MKANVRCGAVALLFLVACNRPDADLFGADASPPGADGTGAAGASVTDATTAGTNAATGGGNSDGGTTSGGAMTKPASGGKSPTAGSSGGGSGGVGGSNPPDNQAGAPDGAAGAPDNPKPAVPVCGNGILEAGEECDDAAHAGKDGCDANCKVVCADYGASVESEDHHCYVGYDQADFEGSQTACVKRGAHLATISSADENKLARSLVNGSKWIGGLEDVPLSSQGTGTYAWLTAEPFTYTNWGPKEPNREQSHCGAAYNTVCYEHCIALMGDGTWADKRCDITDGYVCEWEPAGTKP